MMSPILQVRKRGQRRKAREPTGIGPPMASCFLR